MVRNAVASCYRGCPNAEAVAGEIALNPRGRENLPQPIGQDSARQVDHSQEGTRGQGHFRVGRGMPAKRELRRGVPLPDQYGCGSLDGTDPFSTLLS